MIINFTEEELTAIDSLDKAYEKLLNECDALILKLRPDDPEPDKEEYRKIQESRIPEPVELKPEPVEYTEDDIPVYSKEALDAYHATPEYQAYIADNKRANDAVSKLYDDWYAAGSKKWKDARKKLESLEKELTEARDAFFKKVEDRQFNALGDDLSAILEDARSQVDRLIVNNYKYFEKMGKGGSFSSKMVRAQKDGSFLLDTTEEREAIRRALSRHIEALRADRKLVDILNMYIEEALQKSELVGDTGKRGGLVESKKVYDGDLVTRPKDYVTTVDRVSKKLFENRLTRPLDAQDGALWDVPLDGERGNAVARVAIDYKELIESGAITHLPKLTAKHYILHDAIVTQILAGNRKMTYEMIYRAMTGKVSGKVTVPPETIAFYDEALPLLGSRVQLKFSGKSVDGDELEIDFDEPLITYNLGTAKINGKTVKKVLQIPEDTRFDPLLLKWSRANGNELDTRDITLLDVPKINNTDESLLLKMCLYRRLIKMRNIFERKKGSRYELADNQRTIRYDYVYAELSLVDPDANKRRKLKDKIDKCMKYWTSKGFISGYEHKRDKSNGNNFYAVVVSFMPKK